MRGVNLNFAPEGWSYWVVLKWRETLEAALPIAAVCGSGNILHKGGSFEVVRLRVCKEVQTAFRRLSYIA